ncbi:MAG: ABC transporter ATP-binding protein [Eubacteriales bacterium]|nr:ABC transporter ATP-binding protein [Eubacteriales bacterium]
MADRILTVNDLQVSFDTYAGEVQAVRGVTFYLDKGEVLAIVGESGCGKSVTAQTLMKLNPMPPARIKGGSVDFSGKDILATGEREMRKIRGAQIAMIFQDPMTSLNPTMQVGKQIAEVLRLHQNISRAEANEKVVKLLEKVRIPNVERRIKQYPHEYSGGMRQRAMIAMALACEPQLLIADEPTTALDVTIQAQILELMKELQKETQAALILITHDLGVVASIAHRVAVMYAGRIVETGVLDDIFYRPAHPYTWGLLEARPRMDHDRKEELLAIDGTPPDLLMPPKGCGFADRCVNCMKICREEYPPEYDLGNGHVSACWLHHPDAPKPEHLFKKG